MKQVADKVFGRVALNLLLIATTFIGISMNGGEKGRISVNFVSRVLLADGVLIGDSMGMKLISAGVLLCEATLYTMLFLVSSKFYKTLVLTSGLVYILLNVALLPPIFLLLIPFILVWVLLLRMAKND